jgi:Uma2 family endonuclease
LSGAEQPPSFTFDEYLKLESVSEVRHEYVGGHVYARSGGSVRHGLLVQLINARLLAAFLLKGCRVHSHDTKLQIPDERTYYPDAYVVCGPKAHPRYDTDAQWVVEVRSPTTAATDDREKAPAYMQLPSPEGYILADRTAATWSCGRRQRLAGACPASRTARCWTPAQLPST